MSKPTLPLFDSGDPTLGEQASREFGEGDPNADLVGYSFEIEGKPWQVTGTPVWSDGNYVVIESEGEKTTVRPSGLVRRHKQLMALEVATVRGRIQNGQ